MKKALLTFASIWLLTALSFGQTWDYRTAITLSSNGVQETNFQVKLTLNTQALISAGKLLPDAADLRFGDACMTTFYNHWIESALNTDTTVVWVRVPSIPASGDTSIFMYYGNATAVSVDNFAATFPLALITGGTNTTLTGNQTIDWLQVDSGDTLFLTAGNALTINGTRKAMIDGVIWGKGLGHQPPGLNINGTGPGGGTASPATNSGSGGGSYGGFGGTGGYDAGDAPGTGGSIYGTDSGTDIDMGSSGGGAATDGGSGGGGFSLAAETLILNGSINVDGNEAPTTASSSRGGGGGSGGGVLLTGNVFSGSGIISANGGNGCIGTSTANDSGGGGGGGRIKQFHGTSGSVFMADVNGGVGGPNGTAAPGQNGTAGVAFDTLITYMLVAPMIGSEETIPSATISASSQNACEGDTIFLSLSETFTTYMWYDGSTASTGFATNEDTVHVIVMDAYGCSYTDTITPDFSPLPVPVITANPPQACPGEQVTLNTQSDFASYNWSTGSTGVSALGMNTGTYTVDVVDTNGCSAQGTFDYTPFTAPTVTITQVDNELNATPGFNSYQWYLEGTILNGETGVTYLVPADLGGNFSVVVTDSNGCTGSDTLFINGGSVNELPSWMQAAYPNPTTGKLTLVMNVTANNSAILSVMDLTGNVLLKNEFTLTVGKSEQVLDLAAFANGTYFVRVELGGKQHTLQVVKH